MMQKKTFKREYALLKKKINFILSEPKLFSIVHVDHHLQDHFQYSAMRFEILKNSSKSYLITSWKAWMSNNYNVFSVTFEYFGFLEIEKNDFKVPKIRVEVSKIES